MRAPAAGSATRCCGWWRRLPRAEAAFNTSDTDPHGEPTAFYPEAGGRVLVEVHQVVRDLHGAMLMDAHVGHRFTIEGGLIRPMEVL